MNKIVALVVVGAGLVAVLVGILITQVSRSSTAPEPLDVAPDVAEVESSEPLPDVVAVESSEALPDVVAVESSEALPDVVVAPPVTIPEEPPPVVLDPHTDIMERLSREELREHLADELVLHVRQLPDHDFPPRQAALCQRFTQIALLLDTDNRLASLTKASLLRGVELEPEGQPTLNQAQLAHALGWLALELSASTESSEQILAQILGHLVLEYFNAEQEHALLAFATFTDFGERTPLSLPVLLGKAYNSAVTNPHFKDAPAVDPLWSEPEGSAFFLLGKMPLRQIRALRMMLFFQSAYSPDEPERFRNRRTTLIKDGVVRGGEPTVDRFGNPGGAIRFRHRGYVELPLMAGRNPPERTIAMWFRLQPLDRLVRLTNVETLEIADEFLPSERYMDVPPDAPIGTPTHLWWAADGEGVSLSGYEPLAKVRQREDYDLEEIHLRRAEDDLMTIVPDRWYFIAYTRSAREASLYLDGELIVHRAETSDLFVNKEKRRHLLVACSFVVDGNAVMMNGSIDDLYIYSRVLSPHEIKLLMAVGK